MEFEAISAVLNANGIGLAGKMVENPNVPGGVFIPIRTRRLSDGSHKPSKSLILSTKRQLEEIGNAPEFIFVNDKFEEAETSLRASMMVGFPDLFRNIFLSVEASKTNIWIDLKRPPSPEERARINELAERSMELFQLPAGAMLSLADIALPTRIEMLSCVRSMAPISSEELAVALTQRGRTIPSPDWINRQLDTLRKAGFVIRGRDHRYTLTLNALRRLGTAKNRRSPDVLRLLALAKGGV